MRFKPYDYDKPYNFLKPFVFSIAFVILFLAIKGWNI